MQNTRTAFIAIVGKPNVGKSSLLNCIIGEKLAIVTSKPQTTRTKITGILTEDNIQLVFIDTPGLHKAKTKLSEFMVKQVRESVTDVDVALMVVEPYGKLNDSELELIQKIKSSKIPSILCINKIDTIKDKSILLDRIKTIQELHNFDEVFQISALENDGVTELKQSLFKYSIEEPHYFESDSITDQPEKVIMGEIIREKILLNLEEEIPHGVGVIIEQMKTRKIGSGENKSKIIDMHATIYCEKKSHKGIIIGKNGQKLKKIASTARFDMENFMDCKINLQVWVKIKDDWRNKEGIMRTLGYQ